MAEKYRTIIKVLLVTIIVIGGVLFYIQKAQAPVEETTVPITKSTMKLTSTAFEHNKNIPSKYTCDGEDVSPPLSISQVPAEAKTLVLIVNDPDAPAGDWVHWTVWNIDPSTTEISGGSTPDTGTEGTTDFKRTGWGGPCPPSGTHRYLFKLYALDTELDLRSSAQKADIEAAMESHIIDKTELAGLYQRSTP